MCWLNGKAFQSSTKEHCCQQEFKIASTKEDLHEEVEQAKASPASEDPHSSPTGYRSDKLKSPSDSTTIQKKAPSTLPSQEEGTRGSDDNSAQEEEGEPHATAATQSTAEPPKHTETMRARSKRGREVDGKDSVSMYHKDEGAAGAYLLDSCNVLLQKQKQRDGELLIAAGLVSDSDQPRGQEPLLGGTVPRSRQELAASSNSVASRPSKWQKLSSPSNPESPSPSKKRKRRLSPALSKGDLEDSTEAAYLDADNSDNEEDDNASSSSSHPSQAPDDDNDEERMLSEFTTKGGRVILPFPLKLHNLLEESERDGLQEIVSFQEDGKVFTIHHPDRFATELMPKYFNTDRMSSFQRQLNLYGFKRVTEGQYSFGHKDFIKGERRLSLQIKRKKQPTPRGGGFRGVGTMLDFKTDLGPPVGGESHSLHSALAGRGVLPPSLTRGASEQRMPAALQSPIVGRFGLGERRPSSEIADLSAAVGAELSATLQSPLAGLVNRATAGLTGLGGGTLPGLPAPPYSLLRQPTVPQMRRLPQPALSSMDLLLERAAAGSGGLPGAAPPPHHHHRQLGGQRLSSEAALLAALGGTGVGGINASVSPLVTEQLRLLGSSAAAQEAELRALQQAELLRSGAAATRPGGLPSLHIGSDLDLPNSNLLLQLQREEQLERIRLAAALTDQAVSASRVLSSVQQANERDFQRHNMDAISALPRASLLEEDILAPDVARSSLMESFLNRRGQQVNFANPSSSTRELNLEESSLGLHDDTESKEGR